MSCSPRGCQRVAGGRSGAQTPGHREMNLHPDRGARTEGQTPMGSTFFSLHYHIVFSTKERRSLIRAEWRPRLHSYLGGIVRGMNGVAETVGGVEDHVHLLASLRPVHCLADVMRDLKKDSTDRKSTRLNSSHSQISYALF